MLASWDERDGDRKLNLRTTTAGREGLELDRETHPHFTLLITRVRFRAEMSKEREPKLKNHPGTGMHVFVSFRSWPISGFLGLKIRGIFDPEMVL